MKIDRKEATTPKTQKPKFVACPKCHHNSVPVGVRLNKVLLICDYCHFSFEKEYILVDEVVAILHNKKHPISELVKLVNDV